MSIKGINTAGQSPARKLLTQLTKAFGGFPQQSCGVLNPRTFGSTFPHSLDHARASHIHARTDAISLRSSITYGENMYSFIVNGSGLSNAVLRLG